MRKHIQGVDHIVIAVHDLDLAAETFTRLGFALTPRGYHDFGSQNHCIMFGDDYPCWSTETALKLLDEVGLSKQDKEKVLGLNARRFFGLPEPALAKKKEPAFA